MTIKDQFVSFLKESTAEVQELSAQIEELEARKKNDHLDHTYIQHEIDPKIGELRFRRHDKIWTSQAQLEKIAEAYRQQVLNSNRIKGEELTDDARLFTCGVKLQPEEIDAIMDRNAGNHTMLQLAVRYAQENGIKINRVYNSGKAAEIENVNQLEGAAKIYFSHWIDKNNASEMLQKFFGE